MSWLSNLFSGGSKPQTTPTPEYYTDPMYTGQQQYMGDYSKRIMEGDIPDYYKWIGQPQSQQARSAFQEASQGLIGAAQEQSAAKGTGRSGSLGADTMGALGNMSAQYQFADLMRAMQGGEDLLGMGTGMATNVRDSAFQQQTDRNQYNQWKYNADQSIQNYLNEARDARQMKQTGLAAGALFAPAMFGAGILPSLAAMGAGGIAGSGIGSMLSGSSGGAAAGQLMSGAGSIIGGSMGGPVGAMAGGSLGNIISQIFGGGGSGATGNEASPAFSTDFEGVLSPKSTEYGSITGTDYSKLFEGFLK